MKTHLFKRDVTEIDSVYKRMPLQTMVMVQVSHFVSKTTRIESSPKGIYRLNKH